MGIQPPYYTIIYKMTVPQRILKETFENGYRVIDGEMYNPKGIRLKGYIRHGYRRINVYRGKKKHSVNFHRLVAFEKFGEKLFIPGIVVRHLDGNSLNNRTENIAIGTQQDNCFDRDPDERLAHAFYAASKRRRFTDEEEQQIFTFYDNCHSYKKTQEQFNISSKGTLFYILSKYK